MSGGLRLHPRYFPVAEATNGLALRFLKIEERCKLSMEKVMEILLAIATETNKSENCKDRKDPKGLDEAGKELLQELKQTEEKYGLTQGETMRFLLDQAMNMNKYLIRHERHPNDPDKKGDEA